MINICDIYMGIFQAISSSITKGMRKLKKRGVDYRMEVESTELEINMTSIKSEI